MSALTRPAAIEVRRTDDTESSLRIAIALPDYFNAAGLEHLRFDLSAGDLFGAYAAAELIGFVLYKKLNPETVELAWLAVKREEWSRGVGTRLVRQSLTLLPSRYRACQVKTLASTSLYAPYERTRRFYAKLGFIPLEVIDPYPGWPPGNPCQLMVAFLDLFRRDRR
jgi:GNAT superfamily N-acetyltransferase